MPTRDDDQRKAFEEAIAADPHDETNHRVFADWLEEHGYDDEAHFHREEWTLEKQLAAEAYFALVLETMADERWYAGVKTTLDQILRGVHRYLDTGRGMLMPMNNESADLDEEELLRHFRILTGRKIPASAMDRAQDIFAENTVFICSCTSDSSFDSKGNLMEFEEYDS